MVFEARLFTSSLKRGSGQAAKERAGEDWKEETGLVVIVVSNISDSLDVI